MKGNRKMKFCIYEVREDERQMLETLRQKYDLELILTSQPLNLETASLAAGCDGVSTLGHSQLNRDVLNKLAEIGIHACSSRCIGINHIDMDAARELKIRISNACYSPYGVADYTVMLMLMLIRRYKPALWRQQVNDYSLGGLMGRELRGMTVGIIGTGRIGCAVMQNLSGFGCKLLCSDVRENPEAARLGEYVTVDEIFSRCDMISLHTPLLDSTRYLVNERTLSLMKPDGMLVNCARGELMDIQAVTRAIENQKIGGVAMDVFEKEDGIYHHDCRTDILKNRDMAYLRQFPNVIMTQHMAFYTMEAVDSMVTCGIESLVAFVQGKEYFCEIV